MELILLRGGVLQIWHLLYETIPDSGCFPCLEICHQILDDIK